MNSFLDSFEADQGDTLLTLLKDQYGNYVAQQLLEVRRLLMPKVARRPAAPAHAAALSIHTGLCPAQPQSTALQKCAGPQAALGTRSGPPRSSLTPYAHALPARRLP